MIACVIQDPIDLAICSMLGNVREARRGITEVHFLPFNPTDKRTAITYTTPDGAMHRATKGAPEQILALAANRAEIEVRVNEIINRFAERGLRSLGVAYQVSNLLQKKNYLHLGYSIELSYFCQRFPVHLKISDSLKVLLFFSCDFLHSWT